MPVSRATVASKLSVRSSRSCKSTRPKAAHATALSRVLDAGEIMRLTERACTEARMVASALQDAPGLDRRGMGSELYPFNNIASSEAMQEVVQKIVRGRIPHNPWTTAHKALMATDESGKGYAEFSDTLRDVAFLVGVDYALRSLPSWWSRYNALPELKRAGLSRIIAMTVQAELEDIKGGER